MDLVTVISSFIWGDEEEVHPKKISPKPWFWMRVRVLDDEEGYIKDTI